MRGCRQTGEIAYAPDHHPPSSRLNDHRRACGGDNLQGSGDGQEPRRGAPDQLQEEGRERRLEGLREFGGGEEARGCRQDELHQKVCHRRSRNLSYEASAAHGGASGCLAALIGTSWNTGGIWSKGRSAGLLL